MLVVVSSPFPNFLHIFSVNVLDTWHNRLHCRSLLLLQNCWVSYGDGSVSGGTGWFHCFGDVAFPFVLNTCCVFLTLTLSWAAPSTSKDLAPLRRIPPLPRWYLCWTLFSDLGKLHTSLGFRRCDKRKPALLARKLERSSGHSTLFRLSLFYPLRNSSSGKAAILLFCSYLRVRSAKKTCSTSERNT